MKRICVIGAGVSGLACAAALQDGHELVVVEKSRGIGGRMATRRTRVDGGPGPTFDHGAQYVTARGADFVAFIEERVADGTADVWVPAGDQNDSGASRYVGVAHMPDLVRALAEGLDIRYEITAGEISSSGGQWNVEGVEGQFDHVLSTAPAEQTLALIGQHVPFAAEIKRAEYDACMAAMFGFDNRLPINVDCARNICDRISWVARNASKPGRRFAGDQWVVHAPPEWSVQHLNSEKDAIAADLLDAFRDWAGADIPAPSIVMGHRWKYAQVRTPVGSACLFDEASGLGVAGDWCIGPRVEAAFNSGIALADRVKSALL